MSAIATKVAAIRPRARGGHVSRAIDRLLTDVEAARFHLDRDVNAKPIMLVVIGGTGTGKSTLVNRLLNASDAAPLTAASFRRTFTAGPIAIAHESSPPPSRWLGVEHVTLSPSELPARGRADVLSIAHTSNDLLQHVTIVDTPDLDGDQPAHHAQADRAFRWADAVLFVVTPEKYQMTELLPYYRLANRYGVPALFVMNKVEERAVVEDYAKQLSSTLARDATTFAIPRDDSSFQPPVESNIDALRSAVSQQHSNDREARERGSANRVADLLDRLRDQVLAPLRSDRKAITQICESLRAMEAPAADVDVSPLMLQLRRRLQQRSVLYLMGPGRMLDRVRQVPSLLARLPRGAWDLLRTGQATLYRDDENRAAPDPAAAHGPAFRAALVEQFRVIQARIDDVMRSTGSFERTEADDLFIDPARAGAIADEEIAALKSWLETKWNANPRDTALLSKLMKFIPGGQRLSKWSEAAPYILAAVVAAHHAFFGPIDLALIGGFSLATWLTERLSNEVASRARAANRNITRRFERLAHEQIRAACAWLDSRAPSDRELDDLTKLADAASGG